MCVPRYVMFQKIEALLWISTWKVATPIQVFSCVPRYCRTEVEANCASLIDFPLLLLDWRLVEASQQAWSISKRMGNSLHLWRIKHSLWGRKLLWDIKRLVLFGPIVFLCGFSEDAEKTSIACQWISGKAEMVGGLQYHEALDIVIELQIENQPGLHIHQFGQIEVGNSFLSVAVFLSGCECGYRQYGVAIPDVSLKPDRTWGIVRAAEYKDKCKYVASFRSGTFLWWSLTSTMRCSGDLSINVVQSCNYKMMFVYQHNVFGNKCFWRYS